MQLETTKSFPMEGVAEVVNLYKAPLKIFDFSLA